jgi:type I restriction-modification system DNA methylase subunit
MKEILQQLENILRQGYSPFTIFNDWLDLMLFALQRDDEHYLEIVRRYKNDQTEGEREIDYFCKAFALLQIEMQKTNDDILGQVYMEWNQSTKLRGQFFTPKHIASMMAKMLNPKGRILDPCCGSGVLLIEAIKTMDNEALDNSVLVGQDIDLTCVKMCALNLMFFNVNGYVIWGDSLLLECKKVYQTARSYVGGSISELTGDLCESFKNSYIPAVKETFKEIPTKSMNEEEIKKLSAQTEQLTFF